MTELSDQQVDDLMEHFLESALPAHTGDFGRTVMAQRAEHEDAEGKAAGDLPRPRPLPIPRPKTG